MEDYLRRRRNVMFSFGYLIGDHIQAEAIMPLMLDGNMTCETHALYAFYFPSKYSNPKVRSLIDFLVAELGPIPAWDRWIAS